MRGGQLCSAHIGVTNAMGAVTESLTLYRLRKFREPSKTGSMAAPAAAGAGTDEHEGPGNRAWQHGGNCEDRRGSTKRLVFERRLRVPRLPTMVPWIGRKLVQVTNERHDVRHRGASSRRTKPLTRKYRRL
jgi:hypothetical protein